VLLSCHVITPPGTPPSSHPPGPAWPVLVAESGHNAIHFRLLTGLLDRAGAHAFGRHLAQQHPRPITLDVWRWPADELDVLHTWQADPGPGLIVTAPPDQPRRRLFLRFVGRQVTTNRDRTCAPAW
jgi:hypothetical protein